jgi:glycosyltransferase involved in cell wall biosynthesis
MDGVEVIRYQYAPRAWQTLVNNGGIAANLKRTPWKWLLIPGFLLAQYVAARHIIRTRRIDLIHAHWLIPQGLIAYCLAHGTRPAPYLLTSHGGDLFGLRGRLAAALKRRVAASAATMTVVSTAMREEVRRMALNPRRLEVLPMGVDFRERFIPDASVSRDPDEVLFVGRLVPKKGLRYLLNALPAVLTAWPSVKLTVAGFGPEEGELKRQVRRLGIEDRVTFAGAVIQNELPTLYRRASLLVLPFVRDESGNQEGLPVVAMEAIGCGCPVIVGDVAGISDLFGGMAADICVKAEDTAALAEAILDTLKNPSRAQTRAQAARAAVIDRLDWEVIAQKYATLVGECLVASTREQL